MANYKKITHQSCIVPSQPMSMIYWWKDDGGGYHLEQMPVLYVIVRCHEEYTDNDKTTDFPASVGCRQLEEAGMYLYDMTTENTPVVLCENELYEMDRFSSLREQGTNCSRMMLCLKDMVEDEACRLKEDWDARKTKV